MPAPIVSFDGVTNRNGLLPPDTNGDIGPNHYIQIVNVSFAVYNRNGTVAYGPANNNVLFTGTPICGTHNQGDPVVLYDQFSDRWLARSSPPARSATTSACRSRRRATRPAPGAATSS